MKMAVKMPTRYMPAPMVRPMATVARRPAEVAYGALVAVVNDTDAQKADGGDYAGGHPGGIHPTGIGNVRKAVFGYQHHQSRAGGQNDVGPQTCPLAPLFPFQTDQRPAERGYQNTKNVHKFLVHRIRPFKTDNIKIPQFF